MSTGRRAIIIPAESQTREFDAKLLLACCAAERGYTVIVGSKREINLAIGSLPRSIYLAKGLRNRNLRIYTALDKLGHGIACADEEALIYYSPQAYSDLRIDAEAFRKVRLLLAWGPDNVQLWRQYEGCGDTPIEITGNPRIDLLRPELRGFIAEDARRIREKLGPFVLVNSTFSDFNHFYPNLSKVAVGENTDPSFRAGLENHRAELFRYHLQLLPELAKACPDRTIVLRPHPSENHETWERAARGLDNVRVIHEGPISPWLLAAEVMIHNGCTSAVEAYALGAASIAYQPVTSDVYDLHVANGLSHRAFSTAELLELVRAARGGALPVDPDTAAAREQLIDRFVAARTGPLASDRMAAALARFDHSLGDDRGPSLASQLEARTRLAARSVEKRLGGLVPRHRQAIGYVRHMFAGVALEAVVARIARFGQALDRFSTVRASQLSKNVFEIRAR